MYRFWVTSIDDYHSNVSVTSVDSHSTNWLRRSKSDISLVDIDIVPEVVDNSDIPPGTSLICLLNPGVISRRRPDCAALSENQASVFTSFHNPPHLIIGTKIYQNYSLFSWKTKGYLEFGESCDDKSLLRLSNGSSFESSEISSGWLSEVPGSGNSIVLRQFWAGGGGRQRTALFESKKLLSTASLFRMYVYAVGADCWMYVARPPGSIGLECYSGENFYRNTCDMLAEDRIPLRSASPILDCDWHSFRELRAARRSSFLLALALRPSLHFHFRFVLVYNSTQFSYLHFWDSWPERYRGLERWLKGETGWCKAWAWNTTRFAQDVRRPCSPEVFPGNLFNI